MSGCQHKACRRLAGCAFQWEPPVDAGDSHTCWCGMFIQGGRAGLADHERIVHGDGGDTRKVSVVGVPR